MMKVSVIIPTHNRPSELKEAIESVSGQTRKPEEIIIIDDASDLDTQKIINNLAVENINIKYERTPFSKGPAYSRNRGANLAQGDILMFLDDDDTWETNKIQSQLEVFSHDDQIGLVYSGRLVVNSGNRTKVLYKIKPLAEGNLYPQILYKNVIGVTSSVAIRKILFDKIGGFDEKLSAREDYDLWIRCCQQTIIGHDSSCHLRYILSENSNSQISGQLERNIKAIYELLAKYEKEIASEGLINTRKIRSMMFFHVAKIVRGQGLKNALPWIWSSFIQYPNLQTMALILPINAIQQLKDLKSKFI
jgi:glycosyltransferase involved in cell wall biosynthesis